MLKYEQQLYAQINDLVVMDIFKKGGRKYYELVCSLGHSVTIRADTLKEDKVCKKCPKGSKKVTLKVGYVKSQLKVIEILPKEDYTHRKVKTLCTCGNIQDMYSCNVIKKTQNHSCGKCKPYYKEAGGHVIYFYPHENGVHEVLVDSNDVELIESTSWTIHKDARNRYVRQGGEDRKFLHRILLNCPEDKFIDHINGNGLDNRRSNIRVVDKVTNNRNTKINSRNTTGQMGVTQRNDNGKWRAWIGNEGGRVYLGQFDTREDAIRERKLAELKFNYHENHGRIIGDLDYE